MPSKKQKQKSKLILQNISTAKEYSFGRTFASDYIPRKRKKKKQYGKKDSKPVSSEAVVNIWKFYSWVA